MEFLTRILIGLIVCVVGFGIVWKTRTFVDIAGPLPWIERQVGFGGTIFIYKLVGVVVILIGFLVITNLFDLVIGGLIADLF